jgi:hypothetical protein
MRVGSSSARPEEERAAEVQSDLEHGMWPFRADELEQPPDLLGLLHDSDLRDSERISFVERKVLGDCADPTQLSERGGVTQDTSNDSVSFCAYLGN